MALVWFFGLLERLSEVINTMVNEKSPGPAASYSLLLFSVWTAGFHKKSSGLGERDSNVQLPILILMAKEVDIID